MFLYACRITTSCNLPLGSDIPGVLPLLSYRAVSIDLYSGLMWCRSSHDLVLLQRRTWVRVGCVGVHSRIHCTSANDCPDGISVPERGRETFDVDSIDGVCTTISISGDIKSVTGSRGRKDAAFGSGYVELGRKNQIGAGDDGALTIACLYGVEGLIEGINGGRACRVDGETRTSSSSALALLGAA